MKLPHEQLAEDLMRAGLSEMSFAATEGRYYTPLTLARELVGASRGVSNEKRDAIIGIYRRHMQGGYDAALADPEERTKDMD